MVVYLVSSQFFDIIYWLFCVFFVFDRQFGSKFFYLSNVGFFLIGKMFIFVVCSESNVFDGKFDENKVDEEQLGWMVVGVDKGGEFFIVGVVE